jgi:hypothetical protein
LHSQDGDRNRGFNALLSRKPTARHQQNERASCPAAAWTDRVGKATWHLRASAARTRLKRPPTGKGDLADR